MRVIKLIITISLLLGCFSPELYAQNRKFAYVQKYDENGKSNSFKQSYLISEKYIFVELNAEKNPGKTTIIELFTKLNVTIKEEYITDCGDHLSFVIAIPQNQGLISSDLVDFFNSKDAVKSATPFVLNEFDQLTTMRHTILASPKNEIGTNELELLIERYNGVISRGPMNDVYQIRITKNFDPAEVCVSLFETGLFDYCHPDKLTLMDRSDLDYYADQWYVTGEGTGVTADLKIEEAWAIPGIKQGDGIVVAVLDDGVYPHTDLSGQLAVGYDALPSSVDEMAGPGSIELNKNNGHGTSVAGIIVGDDNSYGVKGVAYNAKVMPVRIATNALLIDPSTGVTYIGWMTTDLAIADAILTSSLMGADIINCSFVTGSAPVLDDALAYVIINGRGAKGTVVIAASGNKTSPTDTYDVKYPANHPMTIAVGASTKTDAKAGFSCYIGGVDVVAPGEEITTLDIVGAPTYDWDQDGDITDDDGSNGSILDGDYGDFKYTGKFSGTSAASPVTAGVMALILSNNPTLNQAEARFILENTCVKPTGYTFTDVADHHSGTWVAEMGYGRINALEAVNKAIGLVGGTDLGGASGTNLDLLSSHVSHNVCYNPDYPTIVYWEASASLPHGEYPFTRYIANALIESEAIIDTEVHGVFGGAGMEVVPTYPGFWGDNDALVIVKDDFFDNPANVGAWTYPIDVPMQLQLSSRNPLESDPTDPDYVEYVLHDFNVSIGGIKIVTDETDASICLGNSYSFIGSVNGSGGIVKYSIQRKVGGVWVNLTTPIPTSIDFTYSITSSNYDVGTNYYRVRAENEDGCVRKSETLSLFVSDLSIENDYFDVCLNDVSVLLDLNVSGGVGVYAAVWTPAVYLSDPTIAEPLFDPTGAVTTDYTVVVYDEIGCNSTENVHVEVHTAAYISMAVSAMPDVVCRGGDADLYGISGTGYGPPYTYIWSDDLGTNLLETDLPTTYSVNDLDATTTFTYTIYDKYNCTGSDDVTVIVDPSLGPNITPIPPIWICPGGEVLVDPTINLPLGGGIIDDITFSWSNGSTSPSITVSDLVTTDYTLHIIDENGCYDEETAVIIRNPALGPLVSLSFDNEGEICYNEDAEISSVVIGGTPDYSYLWSTGETTTSVMTDETSLSLTVNDAAGCISSESIELAYPERLRLMEPHHTHPELLGIVEWQDHLIFNCPGEVFDTYDFFTSEGGTIEGGVAPYTVSFHIKYSYYDVITGHGNVIVDLGVWPVFEASIDPTDIGLSPDAEIYNATLFHTIMDASGCEYESPYYFVWFRWPEQQISADFTYYESPCQTGQGYNVCLLMDDKVITEINGSSGTTFDVSIVSVTTGVTFNHSYSHDDFQNEYCLTFNEPGQYSVTITVTGACGSDTQTKIITVGDVAVSPLSVIETVCDLDANISNYGKYSVETNTSCSVDITTSNHVRYIAGETVLLQPGFHSHYQSDFVAKIDACLLNKSLFSNDGSDEMANWKLYPNPNVGLFKIEMDRSEIEAELQVYDVFGSVIKRQILTESTTEVDLRELPKGLYFVHLKRGKLSKVEKVIIQ